MTCAVPSKFSLRDAWGWTWKSGLVIWLLARTATSCVEIKEEGNPNPVRNVIFAAGYTASSMVRDVFNFGAASINWVGDKFPPAAELVSDKAEEAKEKIIELNKGQPKNKP